MPRRSSKSKDRDFVTVARRVVEQVIVRWTIAVAGLILVCAASASAQKLDVKIVDRQDKEDEYDYAAVYNNVTVGKSFKVHGATFTLQLPDGRLAIVNCESKFAEHMAGRVAGDLHRVGFVHAARAKIRRGGIPGAVKDQTHQLCAPRGSPPSGRPWPG